MYLSAQERIHHPMWIRKKCSICSQIVLTKKSLAKVEWDLKRVSNLIQMINDYYIKSKYYLKGLLMEAVNDILLKIDEPTNYLEVIYDIYFKKWLKAMDFMY
jgi:hypothetical protein